MTITEVRCPSRPSRLFTKLRLSGEQPRIVPGNLMEFACSDCRKALKAKQVLHRYNLEGELVETEVIEFE